MNKYFLKIEIPEGEIKKIFEELSEAQEKIMECYNRLEELGVVTMREKDEPASGN